jgi:hypothetical protein
MGSPRNSDFHSKTPTQFDTVVSKQTVARFVQIAAVAVVVAGLVGAGSLIVTRRRDNARDPYDGQTRITDLRQPRRSRAWSGKRSRPRRAAKCRDHPRT